MARQKSRMGLQPVGPRSAPRIAPGVAPLYALRWAPTSPSTWSKWEDSRRKDQQPVLKVHGDG